MKKPKRKTDIDLSELIKICAQYIDFIDNDDEYYEDNNYSDYIFECAMEAVFGKEVWEFVNNRQE